MKLVVLKEFNDALENKARKIGDVFEADAKRAKELLEHPLKLVEKAANEVETAEKKPVVKKASKPAAK